MKQKLNMHAGTIEWNGSDLSRIGKPKITIKRSADPPAPAFATRTLVNITVTVDLSAMDPGTIQARSQWLANSMRVSEGILRSGTGTGHLLEWLAVPGDNNLQDALTGKTNAVELNFTCVENHGTDAIAALNSASFTPAGSATPIVLHAVRDMKEDIKTARHAERNGARSSTTTTIALTARVAQANPADPLATRLAYLQAQATAVKALDCREGTLAMGSLNKIVRVTEFTPVIDERRGALDVQLQCYHITLPDSGTAECLFDIESKVDAGSAEEVLSLKGEISAETRDIAIAKLNSIRDSQIAIAGQRMVSYTSQDKSIDGHDNAGITNGDWTGALTFSMEIRKILPGDHYTLRISTAKDVKAGMKWSYSGSVTSANEAAAIAIARSVETMGTSAHGIFSRSEETVEKQTKIIAGTELEFVKLDFSYEFEGVETGFISGEIKTEETSPMVGEWRLALSGFLIATDKAAAEAALAVITAAYPHPAETSKSWNESYLIAGEGATPQRKGMRLDFSHAIRVTRTYASAEFTDTTQKSLASMTSTRTISGAIWSDSQANSETILAALITLVLGEGDPHEQTSTMSKVAKSGTLSSVADVTQWIKLDFSASKTIPLTGVVGHDLLEASFTMERVGSIDSTIITPIPFARPAVQVGTGFIPGRMTINASAKAINFATAKTWVQQKRTLVDTIGTAGTTRHETDQPREVSAPEYLPFDGVTPKLWSFSGTYGWTFTGNVLDGVWSAGAFGT